MVAHGQGASDFLPGESLAGFFGPREESLQPAAQRLGVDDIGDALPDPLAQGLGDELLVAPIAAQIETLRAEHQGCFFCARRMGNGALRDLHAPALGEGLRPLIGAGPRIECGRQ